jgi:putative ATP-dependent endonuclease of OLD family
MGINPVVIHDKDEGKERAEIFNNPILEAVDDDRRRIMLGNCIEDVLGYTPPSNEKPYKAFTHISQNWTVDWNCKRRH